MKSGIWDEALSLTKVFSVWDEALRLTKIIFVWDEALFSFSWDETLMTIVAELSI